MYIQLSEKPLGDTADLIFKMASDMGISGNADVAGFVEAKNATKITPDIQIDLKAYIEGGLIDIDPVPYSISSSGMPVPNPAMDNLTPEDNQKYILGSKKKIRGAFTIYRRWQNYSRFLLF
jgi:hypothetical protein